MWLTLLLLAYACAPMVGGHGVAPMALVHAMFPWPSGLLPAAIAVVAMWASPAFTAPGLRTRALVQLAATLTLYGVWLFDVIQFGRAGEPAERRMALESMLLLSLPFQVATLGSVWVLAVRIRSARAPTGAGRPEPDHLASPDPDRPVS